VQIRFSLHKKKLLEENMNGIGQVILENCKEVLIKNKLNTLYDSTINQHYGLENISVVDLLVRVKDKFDLSLESTPKNTIQNENLDQIVQLIKSKFGS